jgi:hypothetical protein
MGHEEACLFRPWRFQEGMVNRQANLALSWCGQPEFDRLTF